MSADFDFEYGTWTVQHQRLTDRLVGSTAWEHFEGTTICAPILGGVGNFEQVWMPSTGMVGMALRLFDQDTHEWTIHWSSSATGRLEPPVVGRFVDGVGTFEADEVWEGDPIRVRFVWDEISETTARWTQAFRRSGDLEWEANWIMELSRQSYDAPAASNTGPPID